ncbi:unnamed protein product, partial [Hapterophycus canaliculatus]
RYLKQEEEPKKVLLVAGDIYRPAAIDQLITLGKRIDVRKRPDLYRLAVVHGRMPLLSVVL